MQQIQTMVREYEDVDAYNRDAMRLASEGWIVQSATERTQSAGCGRCCTLGIFAAVIKPKPHIVVTYTRASR